MPEDTFEAKFSKMVNTQIHADNPMLVPFMVGFQLLDKNDDATEAVGVAAFIIKGVWAYMPVFFVKGSLKGMNSLYLKDLDSFVPSSDNWVSVLKEKGLTSLGKHVKKDDTQDVADVDTDIQNTDIDSLGDTGVDKTASANDVLSISAMEKMLNLDNHADIDVDLLDGVQCLGKTASRVFKEALKNADFANPMLEFYGDETIELLKEASVDTDIKLPSKKNAGIDIITDITSNEAKALTSKEKKALLKNQIFIKDERPEHSKVFYDKISTSLEMPNSTGIYDVLMSDGTLKTFLALIPNRVHLSVYADMSPRIYLVSVDNVKQGAFIVDSQRVLCRPTSSNTTLQSIYNRLKKATKLSMSACTKGGDTDYKYNTNDMCIIDSSMTTYGIRYSAYTQTCSTHTIMHSDEGNEARPPSDTEIMYTDRPGKLSIHGHTLYIPDTAKILRCADMHGSDLSSELRLGTMDTMYYKLYTTEGLHSLTLRKSGDTVDITLDKKSLGLHKTASAMQTLSLDLGIQASQAPILLSTTSDTKSYLIKLASDIDPTEPKAKGATTDVTEEVKVPGGKAISPEGVIAAAKKASETGVKEVFSIDVLKSLASIADIGEVRKEYVTDLMKTLDKVGRLLFLFYWYTEDMEHQYGTEDMAHLEDSLKDIFKKLGDLVLFLKEKSIFTGGGSADIKGDLSEDIGGTKNYAFN